MSGQKFLATIFVIKTCQNTQSQETDRPLPDRTEQYASKEECSKWNKIGAFTQGFKDWRKIKKTTYQT